MECDETILISACLLGAACRYDGRSKPNARMIDLAKHERMIEICPEQMGGLPTPRTPSELVGGDGADVAAGRARVMMTDGTDVTKAFLSGARQAVDLAKKHGVTRAYLKEGSPSCGGRRIKRGEESIPGCGVTTALLRQTGVKVIAVE